IVAMIGVHESEIDAWRFLKKRGKCAVDIADHQVDIFFLGEFKSECCDIGDSWRSFKGCHVRILRFRQIEGVDSKGSSKFYDVVGVNLADKSVIQYGVFLLTKTGAGDVGNPPEAGFVVSAGAEVADRNLALVVK